jgi:Protein of unknown function (DUF2812)
MKEVDRLKKLRIFFDIEKEEKWLNKQLAKGFRCTKISSLGVYTFEETDKKHVMRLDYRDRMKKEKDLEYTNMYEDFGWRSIAGSKMVGIRYWQKEADGHDELFSDRESLAKYYQRLMVYSGWLGITLFAIMVNYIFIQKPSLYHDGLWNMEGSLFWKAFLFETPFALLKALPAIMVILFMDGYYRAYKKYKVLKTA